jgi:PIN domain nuclease of toxin-antitoxin system
MKVLLDTQILIWHGLGLLPNSAQLYISDESNILFYSPASIWEVVIKWRLDRPDFNVDPYLLANGLLADGFNELPIITRHTLCISTLPAIHNDPFDRILLAQAITEGIILLTFDATLAKYGAPVMHLQK